MAESDAGNTGDAGAAAGDASQATVTMADVEKLVTDKMQAGFNALPKRFEGMLDKRLADLKPAEPDPKPTETPKAPKPDERIEKLERSLQAERQRNTVNALKDTVRKYAADDAVDLVAERLVARIRNNEDGSRSVVDTDGVTESYSEDGTRQLSVDDLVKGFIGERQGLARKKEARGGIGFKGSGGPEVPRTGDGHSIDDLVAQARDIAIKAEAADVAGNAEEAGQLRRSAIRVERKISDMRDAVRPQY